ncbi:MAG: methyltransferase [Mycobacteriales bacterium]
MTVLMLGAGLRTIQVLGDEDFDGLIWAELVRGVLIFAFYGLLIRFYLLRGRPQRTSQSAPAFIGAIVATFLPFALPALVEPADSLPLLVTSNLLIAVGLIWSIWALRHLARNVSIVPQARELVRSGPYAILRHPLYVGEIVAVGGVVVGGGSLLAVVLLAVLVGLQIFRAIQEEAVLSACFPEYAAYAQHTSRFVPGLV